MSRIAIIGGGIAGLSTAYYVKREIPSSHVVVFEKEDRFGGTIITEYSEGFLVEGGPDCFVREKTDAIELAEELGVRDEIIEADISNRRTFVLFKNRLHALPEGTFLIAPLKILPFLKSSLISLPGKIRAGLEPFIPPEEFDDESVESFVRRRFGVEILERIAEPLIGGIHAGDVRKLSAPLCLPMFYALEKKYGSVLRGLWKMRRDSLMSPFLTFRRGMGFLVKILVEKLEEDGVELRSSCAVNSVEIDKGRYIVKSAEGDEEFEMVVLATPAHLSAEILRSFPKLREKLVEIEYISTATVSLAFKSGGIKVPRGWGVVIPSVENRQIMAVTFSSLKFKERAPQNHVLIRCFLGGFKNQHLVGLDDGRIVEIVMRELSEVFEVKDEPERVWVYKWFKAMPQYNIGHRRRVSEINEVLPRGLLLAGSGYRGVGIPDCIREGREIAKRLKGEIN